MCNVEFRHQSWWEDEKRIEGTLSFLRNLGAVHAVVEGLQGADNSVPAVCETTHPDFVLVRLHGRNEDAYNAPAASAAERFDYDYPDAEIAELVGEAVRLSYKARHAHIIFNNCQEDKGRRNGFVFLKMLAEYG